MNKELFPYMSKMLSLIVIMLIGSQIKAQSDCKVLMQLIGDSYTGDCKKGLAHGYGEAIGVDTYKGEFKKGLPSGEGMYTWQDGNVYEGFFKKGMKDGKGKMIYKMENKKDSIVTGYWKEDEYIGRTREGYEIIYKSGQISYILVRYKAPSPNYIEIFGLDNPVDLTGNNRFYPYDNVYRNVNYPVTIKVKGKIPDGTIDIDFEIFFEKPGNWTVTVESH